MQIRYTYDRVHADCQTDGATCEHGFYNPCGYYAPIGADCPTHEIETFPIDTDWGDHDTIEPSEVVDAIAGVLGSIDQVETHGKTLSAYSADDCAEFHHDYHETRAAHLTGDPRLLRVLAARLQK